MYLTSCTGGATSDTIDKLFGGASSRPVLSSLSNQVTQQTQEVKFDVNNERKSLPGDDEGMTYTCYWDRVVDSEVEATTSACSSLPGSSISFSNTNGQFSWTPSTSELGTYELKIIGTNEKGATDEKVFTIDVRLYFAGIESISQVQGTQMTLNWTANPSSSGYQILKLASDGSFEVFKTVMTPSATSTIVDGLAPLVSYTWRVNAIDAQGVQDGNKNSLTAITADLIRLEVTSSDSELSPGQSTLVTVRLKDKNGAYLSTSGMTVNISLSSAGTSLGTLSAVNDLGNGSYTSTFTATVPGTLTAITASLNQYYYVDTTAAMQVKPLKIEITSNATSANPGDIISVTAKIRDFNNQLITWGGHSLSFSASSGTSTGSFGSVTDHGNGTYTAQFTAGTAGTALTFAASISTTSESYSTTTITVIPFYLELSAALSDVSVTQTTTITARIKDWQSNYLTTGGKTVSLQLIGASGVATLSAVTDHGDGTYTSTLTGQALGVNTVTGSLSVSTLVIQTAAVTIKKLKLEILTSATHLMPGQAATLTGRVKNWQGVQLTSGGLGLEFSASGGSSSGSIGTVTDNNNGTYTAQFTASSAGTTLTLSGSITDSYQVDVTSTIIVEKWKVYIAIADSVVPAGQSSQVTITLKDYLGVQATSGGQSLFLSQSGGTSSGIFDSITDNNNGTYTTSFSAVTPGTAITISASMGQSYEVLQTASVTVEAIRLVLTAAQSTLNPGEDIFVYAQVKNSLGVDITTGSYTLTFSYTGAGTTTGSFSATTYLGNGLYRAVFSGANAGTAVTLNATTNVSKVITSADTIQVVAWGIEIAAAQTQVTIGQPTTLTIRLRDHTGSYILSGGATPTLTSVTSGIGTISSITDNSDGTYSATFTAIGVGTTAITGTVAGSYVVSVAPTMTVTPVHLFFTAAQSELNPGDSVLVTAQMRDSIGTDLLAGSYSLSFSYSGGTSTYTVGSTLSLGLGLYSATYTGLVAGTETGMTAAVSVASSNDNTVSMTVVPWKIEISAPRTTLALNETTTLTARIKDWQDNYLTTGGKSLNMSVATAGFFSLSSTVDQSDGTYEATIQAGAIGSSAITANISQSYLITSTPTMQVEKIYLETLVGSGLSAAQVYSGESTTATAYVKNSAGQVVNGSDYSISFGTSGGTSTLTSSAVTKLMNGIYQITYTGVVAGTPLTITPSATINYQASSTATVQVVANPTPDASNSTIFMTSNSLRAGNTASVSATMRDLNNNLITNLSDTTFSKTTGAGIGTFSIGSVTNHLDGTYSATLTGLTPGNTPSVLSVTASSTTITQTWNLSITSGSPAKFTISGPTTIAAQDCSTAFQLSFYDANDFSTTLESSTTFVVSAPTQAQFYSDSNCVTPISSMTVASGLSQSQSFYLKSWAADTYDIYLTGSGLTQTNNPYSVTTTAVLSWLGSLASLTYLSDDNTGYTGAGIYDGAFNEPQQGASYVSGTVTYLFAPDYQNHRVTKFDVTDINNISLVGALGKVYDTRGIPTNGTDSSHCTGLTAGVGVTNAFCRGGVYASGTGDGMFKNPKATVVINISGVNYLFVADYNNYRVLKYNADTGEYLGWTGRIATKTGMSGTCLSSGVVDSSTPGWCVGGTAKAVAAVTAAPGDRTFGVNGGNQFSAPSRLATDGVYLYVADTGLNRISKIDPTTGLLVHWLGRISSSGTTSPSAITCLSNSQSDTQAAGTNSLANSHHAPSWCYGGSSTNATYSAYSNANLFPMIQYWIGGIDFYSDGTYNWMIVADMSRITRYLCGAASSVGCSNDAAVSIGGVNYYPGQYFGYSGKMGGIAPTAGTNPTSINSLFNWVSISGGAGTNGWAYYGSINNGTNLGEFNNIQGLTVSGGYAYLAHNGASRVEKMILTGSTSGRVISWIGRVGSPPTAGASGCVALAVGNATPGWCIGGNSTSGSLNGMFQTIYSITNDGTYLYIGDAANFKIAVHRISDGALVKTLGARAKSTPTNWSKNYLSTAANIPFNSGGGGYLPTRDSFINTGYNIHRDGDYLYVADTSNHQIKRYNWLTGSFEGWIGYVNNISPTGGDAVCIGTLTGGFTPGWCKGGNSTSSTGFGFSSPRGITSDANYLYVVDGGNNRIVRIQKSDGQFKGWFGHAMSAPSGGDAGCTGISSGMTPGWCYGGSTGYANVSSSLAWMANIYGIAGFTDRTDNKFYLILGNGKSHLLKIDAESPSNIKWVGLNNSGSTVCGYANGTMVMTWCSTAASSAQWQTTNYINNGSLEFSSSLYIDTNVASGTAINLYVGSWVNGQNGRITRFNAETGAFTGWIGSFNNTITNSNCESGTAAINTKTPSWCTGGHYTSGTGDGQFGSEIGGVYGDSTYLYAVDTANHRIMRWVKSTGVFAGWRGKVDSASGMSGTGCTSLSSGDVTPTWCYGGTSKAGFNFDSTTHNVAFDNPHGLTVIGNNLFVLDSNNGRLLSLPK